MITDQIEWPQLPIKVDLRDKMSPVQNQGELGSSTAHAIGSMVEYLANHPQQRQFLYFRERSYYDKK